MYIDLIVLLLLIGLIVFFFKDFKSFIYSIAIIEIFLRLIHFISGHIQIGEFQSFVAKYIPDSILSILAQYTSGSFFDFLTWVFVILFLVFEVYLVRYLFKKK